MNGDATEYIFKQEQQQQKLLPTHLEKSPFASCRRKKKCNISETFQSSVTDPEIHSAVLTAPPPPPNKPSLRPLWSDQPREGH